MNSKTTRERAIWGLAECLHRKMQHLDPADDDNWAALTDRQREFYQLCVEAVFNERELSRCALK